MDPADVKWITSPYDEYAIEEALRLKEAKSAEVVALSVGEDKAKDVLRNALALGADSAVLMKSTESGDPLAVAKIIAGYAREKGFDVILMGHKGYGGDNASVGPMVAELLNWAQANVVTKLELGEGTFRAEREGDGGTEVIEGSLPAVVTGQRGLNEPRYASLKGIMAAKKKTIEEVDVPSVGTVSFVSALSLPTARAEGKKIDGDAATQARTLAELLKNEAKVL
jgi:electron transfer flavoprotein beta subunit